MPPASHDPRDPSDWECFLLPVSVLEDLDHIPLHESCRTRLEHVVVPAARRTDESIRRELDRRDVCAVSWRWARAVPRPATFDTLRDWSPMTDLQLARLKELVTESRSSHVWVDWSCVPQLSGDTMKFINASYDIYAHARRVVFVPRIRRLNRRGWPGLPQESAAGVIAEVRAAAGGVLASGAFSSSFSRILRDPGRARGLEAKLRGSRGSLAELAGQVQSVADMLHRLLRGEEVAYPTFDYYARAWTLAERLAAFRPSREAPIRLGEMHGAGGALLYAMSAYWRDAPGHTGAHAGGGRPDVTVSDLSLAVYCRGVDPADEDVRELWDDMNHIVQLAPGILGIASETAALAVLCVEWLLHDGSAVPDGPGGLVASLLGECAAYTAIAIAGATMQEEANFEWFRKYLHFQAGSVYGATVARDLILAVYRSCGLPERETADEAVESCLRQVFGDSAEPAGGDPRPGIDRLCRESLRHEDLHTHLLSTGKGERTLEAHDFAPMMVSAQPTGPISVAAWHEWMARSGVVVSWWFSQPDQTMPVDPTEYIDIEHLYCGDTTGLTGLSLDGLLDATSTAVYKLHRLGDRKWRLVQLSLSRRGGRCGEGLSPYRINHGLTLERLLGPDVLHDGRVRVELVAAWNRRLLHSLDEAVHAYWLQCVSSPDVLVVS